MSSSQVTILTTKDSGFKDSSLWSKNLEDKENKSEAVTIPMIAFISIVLPWRTPHILLKITFNLLQNSKNIVEVDFGLESLPGFSTYNPVTDLGCCYISPHDHSKCYLLLQMMDHSKEGFKFTLLRKNIDPECDSPELIKTYQSDCVQIMVCDNLSY